MYRQIVGIGNGEVVIKDNPVKHEKKIWPEYFQKILDGKKTYELRLADWEFRWENKEFDFLAKRRSGKVRISDYCV